MTKKMITTVGNVAKNGKNAHATTTTEKTSNGEHVWRTGENKTFTILIKNPKPLCRAPRKNEIGKWITIGRYAKLASAHRAAAS